MKMIIGYLLVLALLLASCDLLRSGSDVQTFIPGTYVSRWSSDFADTHDTLQIVAQAAGPAIHYTIVRRTFHRSTSREQPLPPSYKIEHWTASYAPREGQLLVHKNGRVLRFDPGKGQLKMGIVIYQKLSD